MDAIQFVQNYQFYLYEIDSIIKLELQPVIDKLRSVDPHDMISPDTWFPSESATRGYIFSLFLREVAKQNHK